jgi:hypothetical protein
MTAPDTTHAQFILRQASASYWKVTFENGPVNLLDPESIEPTSSP